MFVMSSPSSQSQRYQQHQRQRHHQQPHQEEEDELYLYQPPPHHPLRSSSSSFAVRGGAQPSTATSLFVTRSEQQQKAAVLAALVSELSFWEQQPVLGKSSSSLRNNNNNNNSRPPRGMLSVERPRPEDLLDDRVDTVVADRTRSFAGEEDDDHPSSEREVVSDTTVDGNSCAAATARTDGTLTYSDASSSDEQRYTSSAEQDERDWQQRAAALAAAAAVWKTAIDPVSGRAYYYDSLTRQTQWEKPEEVKALERFKKEEKKRQDWAFFEQMQTNLLASLARGELIPGVPARGTAKTGPPQEPLKQQQQSPLSVPPATGDAKRVRTISGMNEQLLKELQQQTVDHGSLAHKSSSSLLKPPTSQQVQQPQASTTTTVSSSHPLPLPASGRPPALSASARSTSGGAAVEGRPPLPTSFLRRAGGTGTAGGGLLTQSSQQHSTSTDSLELSPDHSASAALSNRTASASAAALADQEDLAGEDLLDGPILLEDDPSYAGAVASACASQDNRDHSQKTSSARTTSTTASSSTTNTTTTSTLSHVRRNTGGTIYVKSTMENPDIHAMIKCVCGVYRAHILQSVTRKQSNQRSPVSVQTALVNLDIFKDDCENPFRQAESNRDPPIPTLAEIELFYHDFYVRSQMEHDTIIMSLIYVERLIKETNGVLTPDPSNWRSVLFSCMVLSSKVWDDLSMFNLDFSNVSIASGLSAFSLKRTNALELAVLTSLNFNVRVPASEYAKYYFLLRTMLSRSGLLQEANNASTKKNDNSNRFLPQPSNNGSLLESRTNHYQDSKLWQLQLEQQRVGNSGAANANPNVTNNNHERRTRSVDWSFFGREADPVSREAPMCLEQLLVSMDHNHR